MSAPIWTVAEVARALGVAGSFPDTPIDFVTQDSRLVKPGSLFVALKGSWNRSLPTGYKIVRIPFKDGQPEGYYENFATGFWASGNERAEVWGRPAALAITKDGALLVADDTNGTIWRIAYTGKK